MAEDGDKWQALVNMAVNLQVPQNAGNCLVGFSRRTQLDGISWILVSALFCWLVTYLKVIPCVMIHFVEAPRTRFLSMSSWHIRARML